MSNSQSSQDTILEERYGRGRRRNIDRKLAWSLAGVLVLGGLAFLFFSGWQTASNIDFKTLSYSVVDNRSVTVDGQVTVPSKRAAVCTFEALSPSFATVGWKLVELPASDQPVRAVSTTIVTTSEATTGSIHECWVVESES